MPLKLRLPGKVGFCGAVSFVISSSKKLAMRDLINHDNDKAMREYFDMLEEFNASAQNCFCEKTDYRAAKTDVEPFREKIEAFAAMEVEASGWDR